MVTPLGQRNQESDGRRRRRGIYLLPNLLTTAALFAGFYAVVIAMGGHFTQAAIAIYVAMLMDGLDGRVARLTGTHSDFGVQYDSLSDMVSFGIAPALVMYQWVLFDANGLDWAWAKLAWLAAFIYAAGGALRLARFNTQASSADKRYFQGLASPAAAALVAGFVWAGADMGFAGEAVLFPAVALTLLAGVLMVSNIRYYSFKDFDLRNRVPFVAIVVVVLVFVFAALDPPRVLFAVALVYALSGPVVTLVRLRRVRATRRAQRRAGTGSAREPGTDQPRREGRG